MLIPPTSRRATVAIGHGGDNLSYGKRSDPATLAIVRGVVYCQAGSDSFDTRRCLMRMRWLLAVVPIVLVAADAPKDEAVKQELAKVQGTWQLVSAETDGKTAPDEQVKKTRVVIEGGKHTVY